jgi:hypothetical protein
VRIEHEQVHGTYWEPIGLASAAAILAARLPRPASLGSAVLAGASIADDLEIGRRPLRSLLHQRATANVVAEIGPPRPRHTLVIHAHHDAARTGWVFDPAAAKLATRLAGGLMERAGGTPPPLWGAVLGPALVAAGALTGRERIRVAGAVLSAAHAVAMADIARSPAVPAANDNLSGVCVLLTLARQLTEQPTRRLRVVLLSTGSEESFLEAMVRFGQRHFGALPREQTTFLCLESIGSPHLMLLSGEGLLRLHRYPQRLIHELSELARELGVPLRDPFRYRLATDGQVPLRAGYPTAVLSSMDWYHAPSNYHWPSDRPENLTPESVAAAARLAEGYVRRLDG